jgi:hypothetical protein
MFAPRAFHYRLAERRRLDFPNPTWVHLDDFSISVAVLLPTRALGDFFNSVNFDESERLEDTNVVG